MSKNSDRTRNVRLGIVAGVILVLAAGVFIWQRSTTLKPGTVIIHDDAAAAATDGGNDAGAGEEIEVEELEGVAGDRPAPRGGSRIVENDD